jgi:hypothetical protein
MLRWSNVSFSPQRLRFNLTVFHVGFVVDKVELGKILLHIFLISPGNLALPVLHIQPSHHRCEVKMM